MVQTILFYQEIIITAYPMTSLWIEFMGGAKKLGFGTAWHGNIYGEKQICWSCNISFCYSQ